MADKTTHNKKNTNQDADNMAQSEEMNEAMATEANTEEHTGGALVENPDDEIEKLRAEVAELKDKHLRQLAEFDNFRRRTAKERMELIQTAGKDVIKDLLDVLDDSERAQKQMETTQDVDQIKQGVQLVFTKLRNTLAAKGLKPMEAINKDFNVDQHEAVTEIEAGEEMKGKVVAEIQKGYTLNDKIIRFAKVVVGK